MRWYLSLILFHIRIGCVQYYRHTYDEYMLQDADDDSRGSCTTLRPGLAYTHNLWKSHLYRHPTVHKVGMRIRFLLFFLYFVLLTNLSSRSEAVDVTVATATELI